MNSFRPYLWLAALINLIFLVFIGEWGLHRVPTTDLAVKVFFFFFVLLECPHYFLTFLRSHLDSEELKRHRKFHVLGLIGLVITSLVWNLIHPFSFDWLFIYLTAFHMYKQNMGFITVCHYQVHADKVSVRRELWFSRSLLVLAWLTATQLSFLSIDLALMINICLIIVLATAIKVRIRERTIYLALTQTMFFWLFNPNVNLQIALVGAGIFHALQFAVFAFAFQKTRGLPIYRFFLIYAIGAGLGALALSSFLGAGVHNILLFLIKGVAVYHAIAHQVMWNQIKSPEIDGLLNIQVFNKNPYQGAHEVVAPHRF